MVPDSTTRVFVSYRREDTRYAAGRLGDRLNERFGHVFMDIDDIDPGVDFTDAIRRAVGECDILLALIGDKWTSAVDEHGRRRLDDPDDWIVQELRVALDRGIRVIPVLVDAARMPSRSELPEALAPLARRQAVTVRFESFTPDSERLILAIERTLNDLNQPNVALPATRPVQSDDLAAEPTGLDTDTDYVPALEAVNAERWEQAVGLLTRLLDRYPGDPRLTDKLSRARRQQQLADWDTHAERAAAERRWADVVQALEQITAVDSDYRGAADRLENAKAQRRITDAKLELHALHTAGQRAAALYQQAHNELRAGRDRAAILLFDQLIAMDPTYRDARQLREQAATRLDLASRYSQAQEAIRANDWRSAIRQLEVIITFDAAYRDAAQLHHKALRRQELADRYDRALGAMQMEDWDVAIQEFEAILRVEPGYRDVPARISMAAQHRELADRYGRARRALRAWHWKGAIRGFTEVLLVDPTYRDAERLRGRAWRQRRFAVAGVWTAVVGVLAAAVVVIVIPKGQSRHLPVSAAPIPDETIVVPWVRDNHHPGLFLVNASTGTMARLDGTVADVYEPIVTPDRRTIVYDELTPDGRRTLRAVAADGTGDQELFQPRIDGCKLMLRPAWNPTDDQHIALPCADATFSLRIVSLNGEVVRTLATGKWLDDASFSPDGKTVIYAAGSRLDQPVIYSIRADGSAPAVPLAAGRSPMWSPDGTRIVFSRADITADGTSLWSILVMDPDGANPHQLTSGPEQDINPQWSPDGNTIVFLSNPTSPEGDLLPWLISSQGDSRRPLVPGDDTPTDSQPAWARR